MGRISVDDVKINIEKAFDGWLNSLDDDELEDPENPGEEAQELNAAHAHWKAFLAQVEADQKRASEMLAVCHILSEAINESEMARAKRLAKEVIGRYGEPGGMNAN